MMRYRSLLFYLFLIGTGALFTNPSKAQDTSYHKPVLINENYKGFLHALFTDQWKKPDVKVGQTIKYKLKGQEDFRKSKIDAIGDSTLVADGTSIAYHKLKVLAFTTTQQRIEIFAALPFIPLALLGDIFLISGGLYAILGGVGLGTAFALFGGIVGIPSSLITGFLLLKNKKDFEMKNWRPTPVKDK